MNDSEDGANVDAQTVQPVGTQADDLSAVSDREPVAPVVADAADESAAATPDLEVHESAPAERGIPLQDIPDYSSGPDVHHPKSTFTQPQDMPDPQAPSDDWISMNTDLHDDSITQGLRQLLGEWKIFQKSGLFGMGPSGIEHPLYNELKDLSMIAILNGTFNGATDEVTRSVNQYINGWRYEQAIVPQHTETFENYLRRVVRKILVDAQS